MDEETVGTPATMWSYRDGEGTAEEVRPVYQAMCRNGAAWLRVTKVDGGFWVEGWPVRPAVEGPFDPPMTKAST